MKSQLAEDCRAGDVVELREDGKMYRAIIKSRGLSESDIDLWCELQRRIISIKAKNSFRKDGQIYFAITCTDEGEIRGLEELANRIIPL